MGARTSPEVIEAVRLITEINLAAVAEKHGVDTSTVIAPMRLAVALCNQGVPVTASARQCGVGRTALHRKINEATSAANEQLKHAY
jgi:transposase-like protein